MKPRLLDLIVCPIDKIRLDLVAWETSTVSLSQIEIDRAERQGLDIAPFSKEILTGALLNRRRGIFYPIYQGVPRMLVFPTRATREFAKKYAEPIGRQLSGFRMPDEMAMPGEKTVLRTFSNEWLKYDWDCQSYWNLTPQAMYKSMNFMLDLSKKPVKDKLALEVGVGIGGIADYMASNEECELVGIDLSYSVEPAFRHFGRNAYLHLIQASVFAPPFRENTFDLVYSHGVLHHTFSTKTAFDHICRLPKTGGRLYIWVYSPDDEARNLERRILMKIETIIRPFIARLPKQLQTVALTPIAAAYLLHQNRFTKTRDTTHIKYGWREAIHAARDRFSPRFAHRHTEGEVSKWFQEAGYCDLQCAGRRKAPNFIPLSFVTATVVDGIRHNP